MMRFVDCSILLLGLCVLIGGCTDSVTDPVSKTDPSVNTDPVSNGETTSRRFTKDGMEYEEYTVVRKDYRDEFVSIEIPRLDCPTREEFRKLCDEAESKEQLIELLQQQ